MGVGNSYIPSLATWAVDGHRQRKLEREKMREGRRRREGGRGRPSLASHDDEAEQEEEFAFHYFIPTRNRARVFGAADCHGQCHKAKKVDPR